MSKVQNPFAGVTIESTEDAVLYRASFPEIEADIERIKSEADVFLFNRNHEAKRVTVTVDNVQYTVIRVEMNQKVYKPTLIYRAVTALLRMVETFRKGVLVAVPVTMQPKGKGYYYKASPSK